jgi:hypothetical protein
MDEIQSLKQRMTNACRVTNDVERRNALLDALAEFGSLSTNALSAKDYRASEDILKEWADALEKAQPHLLEKQTLFSHSRLQAAMGSWTELRGLEAYFQHGDFVDAPRLLEKAEIHHERAAEFAAKVPFPAEAPPEAKAMRDRIAALQRAETQRVRGMRLLVQGEFESEAGGLDRAVELLEESIATMTAAETERGPDAADAASILAKGQSDVNFIDFAQALLAKTRADTHLLANHLAAAAAEQKNRAEALKRCQSMHLRAGQPLNESFARRLARDIHVANLRHDRFVAEANKRPRWEWVKAVSFFFMAIGSAAVFMYLASRFELIQNQAIFAVLLLFVMAIAGIGARLVEWKEAANWLRRANT